jgi:hypothetical protein
VRIGRGRRWPGIEEAMRVHACRPVRCRQAGTGWDIAETPQYKRCGEPLRKGQSGGELDRKESQMTNPFDDEDTEHLVLIGEFVNSHWTDIRPRSLAIRMGRPPEFVAA